VTIGLAGAFAIVSHFVDPGGPLDILSKMFPETMDKIDNKVRDVVNGISDIIDGLTKNISDFFAKIGNLAGFKTGAMGRSSTYNPRQYDIRGNLQESFGDKPPSPFKSLNMPSLQASPEDIKSYLKPQSNNTIHINITPSPGTDGRAMARDVRTALNRKPLFDSDGALLPA
jgi:hypothetical protein